MANCLHKMGYLVEKHRAYIGGYVMTSLDSQIAKCEKRLQKKPDPLLADILKFPKRLQQYGDNYLKYPNSTRTKIAAITIGEGTRKSFVIITIC